MFNKLSAMSEYSKTLAKEMVTLRSDDPEDSAVSTTRQTKSFSADESMLVPKEDDTKEIKNLREALRKSDKKCSLLFEENGFCKGRVLELEKREIELVFECEKLGEELSTKEQLIDFLNEKITTVTQEHIDVVNGLKMEISQTNEKAAIMQQEFVNYSKEVQLSHHATVAYYTNMMEEMKIKASELDDNVKSQVTERSEKGNEKVDCDKEVTRDEHNEGRNLLEIQGSVNPDQDSRHHGVSMNNEIADLTLKIDVTKIENGLLSLSDEQLDASRRIGSLERVITSLNEAKSFTEGRLMTLEGENKKLRDIIELATNKAVDAIILNHESVLKSICEEDAPKQESLLDVVTVLGSCLRKVENDVTDSQIMIKQWKETYDQAKISNETTYAQLCEYAQKCESLSAELNLKASAITQLEHRVKQEELTNTMSQSLSGDLQRVRRDLSNVMESDAASKRALLSKEQELIYLQAEYDGLQALITDKDSECSQYREAAENLERVLNQFQQQKHSEIEEQTAYLSQEIESLKCQNSILLKEKEKLNDKIEEITKDFRKDISSKNCVISGLQSKLGELRKILEETMGKLNDEFSIDKRVVSHLLVNYIHSIVEQRGDASDIVNVMSRLLNWDKVMMERAGLIRGNLNPVPGGSSSAAAAGKGFLKGVVKTVWGNPSSIKEGCSNGSKPTPTSLAELWVDFLIKEGENGSFEKEGGSHE